MIKNIYFTYCLIPIIIAKTEIVQHEVYIVANIVPDVRPGCLYRSAKAATIGSSLTQGFAVLRAAFYHWQQVLSPLSIFIMFLEEAMQELKDRIVKEGKILPGNIVKVDGFLNHRVDCAFMGRIADEFKKYFDLDNVDLILTAEASGIALSAICAYRYGKPMVYAKKAKSDNIEGGLYQSEIFSYTYKKKVTLLVSKEWIHPGDRVLVIDDFLARGEALRGLCEIVQAAGAELVGIGCAVEKGFQGGGDKLRAAGVDTRMTKLLSLMVSNGLVGLSGALVCQSQKYGDVGSGTGAIVIGLAAIVIGEVLMGRLTSFYWKLTSVVVGSVIYFVIRAVVLRMGMDANDMKLLSAVIVALALCIPVALAKYRLRKDYSEGGEE